MYCADDNEYISQSIIKNMSEGVISVNSSGIITLANDSALHILERKKDDLIGKKFAHSFFDSSENDDFTQIVLDAIYKKTKKLRSVVDFFANGKKKRLFMTVSYMQDDKGNQLGITLVITDITESERLRLELLRMQAGVIENMADLVENRDGSTGGHIKRTAEYVRIVTKELQRERKFIDAIDNQFIFNIVTAAPLHDIGKISIPDIILNKPGRFTDEEYSIMKTHTTAGRKALQKAIKTMGDSPYLNMAINMAQSHHEWWNGKGYPDGIKGEEIPLCARIMAIADVFDAIVSKRCYKEAIPLDKAYAIIREESGTHFDPDIVEAFFNAQDKIEEALHRLSDENLSAEQ